MAPDSGGPRVAAVMAAYNRRELTLACLRSLRAQRAPGVTLDAFVLDDASTDGTGQAIAEEFPEAALLRGTGRLYWNGGMRTAFGAAIAGDYDYYLWMNDDTALHDGALAVLLDTERRLRERGGVLGLDRSGHARHLRPEPPAPAGWGAVPPGVAAGVVDQRAAARTVGGLQPPLGRPPLAGVLAEPLPASGVPPAPGTPARPSNAHPGRLAHADGHRPARHPTDRSRRQAAEPDRADRLGAA